MQPVITPHGFKLDIVKVWQDFISGFSSWRISYLIGINEIKKKYARSKLGQFWITLSLAINITTLGIVWAYLFKTPIDDFLPYVAFSIIFWSYISNSITEGASIFINFTHYIKELNIARTTYIYSLFIKNLIVLCHNLIILLPIYFICTFHLSLINIFFSIAGIILTTLFLFPVTLLIATISLRFRDVPSIIISVMQIFLYLTPIMWKENFMPASIQPYLVLNPFAVFLAICRDMFFYNSINTVYWLAAMIYIIIAWLIVIPCFSKYRSRIAYWL